MMLVLWEKKTNKVVLTDENAAYSVVSHTDTQADPLRQVIAAERCRVTVLQCEYRPHTLNAVVVSGSAASLSCPRSSLQDFFFLVTFTIPLKKKRWTVFRNSCAIISDRKDSEN